MAINRKAVLAAVDRYGGENNLTSCINDSRAFEALLETHYGFTAEGIHILHNEDATAARLDAELAWLCEDAGERDRLVFHFSGHGYQIPSTKPGQSDVKEEALVLSGPEFYLDDLLVAHTLHLPAGILTALIDCCFAQGMMKVMLPMNGRVAHGKPKRYRPAHPLPHIGARTYRPFGGTVVERGTPHGQAGHRNDKALIEAPPSDEHDPVIQGILLSACLETETASAETEDTKGLSAFTFAMLEAVRELSPGVATRDLVENCQHRLRSMGFRQTPLISGRDVTNRLGERSFILLEDHASSGAGITS